MQRDGIRQQAGEKIGPSVTLRAAMMTARMSSCGSHCPGQCPARNGTLGPLAAGGAVSGPMTGTSYDSVTVGFWSLINVVQMPGMPKLIIVPSGPNSVKILWPDPATNSYTLQQNADLALAAGRTTTGYAITNGLGTNFCTITPPVGNLFFRLE
jgi:hypothetical protein